MVTPYWFPVRGGITTYVGELSSELRAQGHEVLVIASQGGTSAVTKGESTTEGPWEEEGSTGGDLPASPDRAAIIIGKAGTAFARAVAERLESFRPDAVHAHGHWYALAAGLRYRRRHPGCRVVFTLHTPFPRRAWWRRFAFTSLMSRADFVTAVSADLLGQTLRTHGPRARTRVTHPGVRVKPTDSEETEAFRRSFGLEGRGPLIGFLGRLSWEGKVRGVEQLIHAIGIVRQTVPGTTLMVGGDGPHRARLEALAAAEAPGNVVFLGDVPDPAPRFFTAAEVYAHISYQEGLPLALLEAMACNSAIIASAIGGIPEVIRDGDNGFLVSNEPSELATRILELVRSPELRTRLMNRATETVAARFTWPLAAGRFLPLFGGRTRHRVVVTVDLERDYHAPGPSFRGIEEALPKLLDLFDRHGIRATVFATADLCDRFPEALRRVIHGGHELGCHGESHDVEYLSSRTHEWQLDSIRRATQAIEAVTGISPRGFRAPNFSANGDTIRVLEALGYAYDSSVLPGRVVKGRGKRLDFLVAPRDPYRPSRDDPARPGDSPLWELPVAENPFAPGGPIGLGYVNASGIKKALDAVARSVADPCVFLIHPWELVDPPRGPIPAWMRKGCTSNPAGLDDFLGRLRTEHEVTTFAAVLDYR